LAVDPAAPDPHHTQDPRSKIQDPRSKIQSLPEISL
jgi:hypothetical protein